MTATSPDRRSLTGPRLVVTLAPVGVLQVTEDQLEDPLAQVTNAGLARHGSGAWSSTRTDVPQFRGLNPNRISTSG